MGTTQNHADRKSFMKLWPPSEKVRSVLVEYMSRLLSSGSFTFRSGDHLSEDMAVEHETDLEKVFAAGHLAFQTFFSKDIAVEHATEIEGKVFAAANSIYLILDDRSRAQFYAKEISKRFCDYLEQGPPPEGKNTNVRETSKLFWDAEVKSTLVRETSELFFDYLERGPPAKEKNTNVREASPEIVEMKETVFDMSTGERRFLDRRRARKLFAPLEGPGNSYTKICFGNKSFGVEAALVARRFLMGVQKTLKDVELVDFYFERWKDEALEVMSILSSAFTGCMLRSLSLHLDRFVEKGIKAFGPLLKSQKMLEELKFICTRISRRSARAICETLSSIENIKSLHFYFNASRDDAAVILSALVEKCFALEDFEFSGSYIGTRGAEALLRALSRGSRLKFLNLQHNRFGTTSGVTLSQVISIHLSQVISIHLGLSELYFDQMHLLDEGTIAIANSLKTAAPSLRVLAVRGNMISPRAAPALAECLAVKNLLTMFYAGDNFLRDSGACAICKAIVEGHEKLKELDLSHNGITDIGAKFAAEAVANKPDFSRLSISENFITEEGTETVKEVLRKGTKGDSVLSNLYQLEIPDYDSTCWN